MLIPVARNKPDDVLVWRGDNIGVYTMKSGYKWQITAQGSSLQTEYPTSFYTKLWGLKMPNKIRINMWKIANNYILTLYNLKLRKLAANTLCPVCQAEEETVSHLFRDCLFSQQVLRGLRGTVSSHNGEPNWKKWLDMKFNSLNNEECKIRVTAYWAIWYNRNKIYH